VPICRKSWREGPTWREIGIEDRHETREAHFDPEKYAGRFASICRMPGPVCDSMKIRLAALHGVGWEKLRVVEPAPSTPGPLLIFHDRRDAKVPLGDGRAIAAAWPGARLVTTQGLGHHRILRSAEVHRRDRLVSSSLPARRHPPGNPGRANRLI
jgi:pimeloyl-ACP methyl ester carboxylesterase